MIMNGPVLKPTSKKAARTASPATLPNALPRTLEGLQEEDVRPSVLASAKDLPPTPSRAQLKAKENGPAKNPTDGAWALLERYGCGPIQFAGSDNASYERHLIFDNVITPDAASPRERFEALARSVRDVLSQCWVRTAETYAR